MQEKKTRLGIDIGGSHISAAVVANGKVLAQKRVGIKIKTRKRFFTVLFDLIESLIDRKIKSIGVGFPSPIINGAAFEIHHLPYLEGVNIKKEIERKFRIKASVDNDANCFALAEAMLGAGKGKKSVVGITLGTGMGCGIVIDGKIYSGNTGAAGEISKIPFKGGKLEDFANAKFLKRWGDPKKLEDLAKKGNKKAKKAYAEFGKNLGTALSIVINTLDPEIIVLGGKISNAYSLFRKEMINEIRKNCYKYTAKKIKIVKSKLKDSAVLGAALT